MHGFFLMIILLTPWQAFACSCAHLTVDVFFKMSPLVVSATVIKAVDSDKVQLHFDEIWKGKAPEYAVVKLTTGLSSSCGSTGTTQPEKGTKYLLYLGQIKADGSDEIHLGACNRNNLYDDLREDIPFLENYRKKLQAVDAAIKTSHDSKEEQYKKMLFLREHGDPLNAIDLLKYLTNKFPKYDDAWAQLAQITFEQATIIREFGSEKEALLQKKQGGYADALKYAEQALVLNNANQIAKDIKQISLIKLERLEEVDFNTTNLSKREIHYQTFLDKTLDNTLFSGSQFFWVEFANSRLTNVSFRDAKLRSVKFSNSSLISANFDGADIVDGILIQGQKAMKFKHGGFEDSKIINSSFKRVNFNASIVNTMIDGSDFEEASFTGGYGENERMLMLNVKANNTNFRKISTNSYMTGLSEIRDSVFVKCDFSGAKISSKITNVDFSKSKLSDVDLSGSSFDCKSKWPDGIDPVALGAVHESEACGGKPLKIPDFSGKKFSPNNSFANLNLENANFTNSDLNGASFYKTNLKNADFTNTIGYSDLREANLENAKLRNLYLYGVNFDGANLKNTDFLGSDFSNARFDNTNLNEANLTLARLATNQMQNLPKDFNPEKHQFVYWANNNRDNACLKLPNKAIDMSGSNLSGINLAYSCLNNMNFKNTNFDKATLYNADMRGAQLDGASFKGTKYSCDTYVPEQYQYIFKTMILIDHFSCDDGRIRTTVILPNADLSQMNLRYANLQGADLHGADLSNTNLVGADLTGANLTGAKFTGAAYAINTKWPDGFDYKVAGAVESKFGDNRKFDDGRME